MWPRDAYIGQKVIAVRDDSWCGQSSPLIKGNIYTITRLFLNFSSEVGMEVAEAALPKPYKGFHHSAFRPVVSRSTDISIFTAMLDPTKVHEDA